MTELDARGRSCPEPMMLTRAALKAHPEGVTVMVDTICAAENITRFGGHQGYAVKREERGDEWVLTLAKA